VVRLWEVFGTPSGTPVLQLAANGRWESAEILPMGSDPSEAANIADRLGRDARFLAMEVMWPGEMFVGTGWPAAHRAEAEPAAERVLRTVPSTPDAALAALLGEPAAETIEAAELGAVNAWMSVGPLPLWERGGTVDFAALDARPDLLACTHPVALEFRLGGPRPQWAAVVVSSLDGSVHRIDLDRLAAVASALA